VGVYVTFSWAQSLAGLTTEAKEHAHLALRLSPRDLDLWLGDIYLALLQASFADGDFPEAQKWGLLAIQMTPKAPIRRALMAASYAHMDNMENATQQLRELERFSPDFAESILRKRMSLYKLPEHNQLLIEGLKKAGAGQ